MPRRSSSNNSNDEIANEYDHLTPPNFPIAYVAKKWFFCGLPFYVTSDVLVPRADSEILVEQVIATQSEEKWKQSRVLDLCTGSGCIAVALAKKGFRQIMASDISEKAVKVARKNAKLNDVKVNFIKSDLFKKFPSETEGWHRDSDDGVFDIITCNPPYIKTNELGKFDLSILHEPKIALDGGADGLAIFRRIIKYAPNYLAQDGRIFFEVGDKNQAEEVKNLLLVEGFRDIVVMDDRVVYATNPVR